MVYEELKMQILTGAIVPGTRMMEVDLANQIGVSRTPVREAIRKLEKEGLVVIEPRKGAYASQISTKDMVEILEVRQNMEGLAAYFAASRMQPEQLEELKEVSSKYNTAVTNGNMEDMIKYDTRFHRIIVESCNNKILVQMIEQLQELGLIIRLPCIVVGNVHKIEPVAGSLHVHPQLRKVVGDRGGYQRVGGAPLIQGKAAKGEGFSRTCQEAVWPARPPGKCGNLAPLLCQQHDPLIIFTDRSGQKDHSRQHYLLHCLPLLSRLPALPFPLHTASR